MKKKISVIIKEPWMKPRHTYISNTLENLQRTVEGYIEHVDLGHDGLNLIVNEEGVLRGLPPCCEIDGYRLFGTVIFCGVDGEDFGDVPVSCDRLLELYPQMWYVLNMRPHFDAKEVRK